MLVLTRKPQEKIRIGDDITITVIKTKGKTVRIGIEAPSDVNVLRGELVFDNESENSDSVQETASSAHHNRVEKVMDQQSETMARSSHSGNQEPQTEFVRTSRSRIKALLPELLGDAGPLREMLDRRAEVS